MTEEEKRTREDQEMDDIDSYLSGIEPGYTVIIQRLEPMYAKGVLDEISVDATQNPINLKYLINTWGGHKLRLKFRRPNGTWAKHRDLNLYSFPPLLYGVPIQPEMSPHQQQHNQPDNPHQPPPYYAPPPPSNDKKEWLEMMALMQKMRSDDITALGALVNQQKSEPPYIDPIRLLQGAFGLFAQFQQFRSPAPEKGENDEILGFLGKAVDVFSQNMRPQQETRITPPSLEPRKRAPGNPPGGNPDVASLLSQLEPEEAIRALQLAAGKMDPDKQARLMGSLIGSIENIGGEDLLLDQLEQRGILGGDDDDEETSDDENADSGGEPQPNEGNHSPDRPGDTGGF